MTTQKMGRYIIQETLGQGAMGAVFKALDPMINRQVAIKTILMECLKDPEERDAYSTRFFREAQICGQLKHPSVVTLHDIGEHENVPFIVMEYVQGQLLADLLATGNPLNGETIQNIIKQMASALDAAHNLGIVHRDIKPQNVMITHDGEVKILDFGIAKLVGKDLTLSGEYLGTPSYSSPEQITEQQVDGRSDLFSFAVLTHKLITGKSIYAGSSLKEIFTKILYEEPKPREPLPHLGLNHHYFRAVLTKALDKNPNQRYQKGLLFAQDISAIFSGGKPAMEPGEITQSTLGSQTTETLGGKQPDLHPSELKEKEAVELRARRLKQWQTQFKEALAAENLMACRNLIMAMNRRGENCDSEVRLVKVLEIRLEHAAKKAVILKLDREFDQALMNRDLVEAGRLIRCLQEQGADVKERMQLLLQEQKTQKAVADQELNAFNQTLTARDLGKARGHLMKLKKMGASVDHQQKALKDLEQEKMGEARRLLKDIVTVRERFQAALSAGDQDRAEEALNELKTRKASCSKEEDAFLKFKESKKLETNSQAQTLKTTFRKALKKDPVEAERALKKLVTLGADIPAFHSALVRAKKKAKKRRLGFLEKEFEIALNANDTARARTVQQELASLDAESPLYSWLLKKASGKDPGPRPRNFNWFPLAGLIFLAIVVLVFFLFR